MSSTIYSHSGDTIADRHVQRLAAARQRWPQYPSADVERMGKFIHDKATGHLFEVIQHVVFAEGADVNEEGVHGFLDTGDDLLFLTRATPATLEELRAGEAEHERQRLEREDKASKAHAKFLNAQPRQPLTLTAVEGKELPTLAAAYQALVDHGAEITANNDTLSIALPQRLHEDPNQDAEARRQMHEAARLLDYCRLVVVTHLQANRELPSGPITVGGGAAR